MSRKKSGRRRQFGSVRQLPSKRWQASYLVDGQRVAAPTTFSSAADANAFLSKVETEQREGQWVNPSAGQLKFSDYSRQWLEQKAKLSPRTRELYEGLLRLHIDPTFGQIELRKITPAAIRSWNANLAVRHQVTSAKAYRLLKQILGTASGNTIPIHVTE